MGEQPLPERAAPPPTAVVLCAGRGGLGAVRALHKHGVPTVAIAFDPQDPVLDSRIPIRKLCLPAEPPEVFEDHLRAVLREPQDRRQALIPTSDQASSFIRKYRDELAADFGFCLPDGRLVDALNDKAEETRLIASLGIPVPRTAQPLPTSCSELERIVGLPVIVKPRSFEHKHRLSRKNVVLRTRGELEAFYESHGDALDVLIAQEVVPGADDTLWLCSGTFNRRHEFVEGLVKRKIRMSPPHFGVCSFAVSASNPEVLELTARLGSRLRYTGHVSVEFKWDHRERLYKYIELNPRLPASVALDEASGVPTVWNTYRVALGEDVEAVAPRQRDGVVYLMPLDDAYNRLKDGESLGAILRHYLAWGLHKRVGPHFAWNDPWPGIVHIWTFFRKPAASRLRRFGTAAARMFGLRRRPNAN